MRKKMEKITIIINNKIRNLKYYLQKVKKMKSNKLPRWIN